VQNSWPVMPAVEEIATTSPQRWARIIESGKGVIPEEAVSTFAVMAAVMLVEACGGRALGARWTWTSTARSVQTVNARNASAA
jgi:hypothetical protein